MLHNYGAIAVIILLFIITCITKKKKLKYHDFFFISNVSRVKQNINILENLKNSI